MSGLPDSQTAFPLLAGRIEPSRRVVAAVWAVIGLSTVAAFAPTLMNGFVAWDDHENFLQNPHYRGLGLPQLRWMVTSALLGNYVPVTWLTLGLDYLLWGIDPRGYHLTSLLLHAANAILLFHLACRLLARAPRLRGRSLWIAATVAALFFALHPLRVESVAWASERRDVVSGLLFLSTVLVYLRMVEAHGRLRTRLLVLSVALYGLAMGAKPLVMTLPAVLLLLDVYPLGRLPGDPRAWLAPSARGIWAEKLPYAVVAAAGAAVSYAVHAQAAAVKLDEGQAVLVKTAYTLWFYAYKTFAPVVLSPMYERPVRLDPLAPSFLVAELGVLTVTLVIVALRRWWPALLAVWIYAAITLAPVGSLAHAGAQITADRYSYLGSFGWALLVGGIVGVAVGAGRAPGAWRWRGRLALGVAGLGLVGLAVLTWHQVRVWRSTETLWTHAVRVDPRCAFCRDALGGIVLSLGRPLAALEHLQVAAALRPGDKLVHARVGAVYVQLGMLPEAAEAFRRELATRPHLVEVRASLARVLLALDRPGEAVGEWETLLRSEPHNPGVHANLGVALDRAGRPREAIAHLQRAIALGGDPTSARLVLAEIQARLGEPEPARVRR
jgi:hypothetical protein